MVLWAVYIVASDLASLTMDVIWKALAVLCISVLGRFFFQWLMDISMSAKGFDIFRDYRLHVGALMRKAPMGYFSEQRLGSIQNVLTTTVTELEQYSMMAVTDLTSGALMALVNDRFLPIFRSCFCSNHPCRFHCWHPNSSCYWTSCKGTRAESIGGARRYDDSGVGIYPGNCGASSLFPSGW